MAPRAFRHSFHSHWRLFGCLGGAAALFLVLPHVLQLTTRLLIAWNAGVLVFLALTFLMMRRATHAAMRRKAEEEDAEARYLLVICVAAAIASLAAIVMELGAVKALAGWEKGLRVTLVAATIVTSWIFIHCVFTLHYAREYFVSMRGGRPPALGFPGEKEPDYGDFLYFAFVIGVASQTADVAIASRRLREIAMAHGVVAFFFNATILALTVNIGAGMI